MNRKDANEVKETLKANAQHMSGLSEKIVPCMNQNELQYAVQQLNCTLTELTDLRDTLATLID